MPNINQIDTQYFGLGDKIEDAETELETEQDEDMNV